LWVATKPVLGAGAVWVVTWARRASMFRALLDEALGGRAGTTALNPVAYLNMAVRARPASETRSRRQRSAIRPRGWPRTGPATPFRSWATARLPSRAGGRGR